jgi:hypothetical protein
MASIFRRKKKQAKQPQGPRLVSEKSADEEGFKFEILSEKTVDTCVDAMIKAMPQAKWNRKELSHWLLAPNSLTLIAKFENTVAGVISGTVLKTPAPPPTIRLMAVLNQRSGEKGLGKYLINTFILETQRRAPKAACVDVALPSSERTSIALYSLMGFDVNGFVKNGFRLSFAGTERQDLVLLRRRYTAALSPNLV